MRACHVSQSQEEDSRQTTNRRQERDWVVFTGGHSFFFSHVKQNVEQLIEEIKATTAHTDDTSDSNSNNNSNEESKRKSDIEKQKKFRTE